MPSRILPGSAPSSWPPLPSRSGSPGRCGVRATIRSSYPSPISLELTLAPVLIAACLLALVAPRPGSMVITLVFAYGMATDQTRMQPEFFSLPLLLWGSLPSASARLVGRASLFSLWFFAGLHKMLSPDYLHDGVRGW